MVRISAEFIIIESPLYNPISLERTEERIEEVLGNVCKGLKDSNFALVQAENSSAKQRIVKIEGEKEKGDIAVQKNLLKNCRKLTTKLDEEITLLFHNAVPQPVLKACTDVHKGIILYYFNRN